MSETSRANSWNDAVIEQFMAGRERIADMFDRSSLLLLDTVGARSGQVRTSPVMYFEDGDRLVIIASAAGADKNPDWYANLVATPEVTVRLWRDDRIEQLDLTAVPAEGTEREHLWNRSVEIAPGFADYQTKTSRVIPVVTLTRA